jgi:hypothetical protein
MHGWGALDSSSIATVERHSGLATGFGFTEGPL